MVFGKLGSRKVKVMGDDGKPITAGLVEGAGIFRCNTHNFETEDFGKFQKHVNDGTHTTTGSGPCDFCGKPVSFVDKGFNERTLCQSCTENLKQQLLGSKSE